MGTINYTTSDTSDGTLDISLLGKELAIEEELATAIIGISRVDSSFSIEFAGDPTISEQSLCDAVVASHSSLPATKDYLVSAIKNHRDGNRLSKSLHAEYPAGSGVLFACSAASQDNWSKLANLDAMGAVVYPYKVTSFDEKRSYDIIDSADRVNLTLAVASVVQQERDLASTYIDLVLSAATAEEAESNAQGYLNM